jgi:hypothetical protein
VFVKFEINSLDKNGANNIKTAPRRTRQKLEKFKNPFASGF